MPSTPTAETASREPILSLPNLLTLARLPLAACVWFVAHSPWALFGLMAAAAASDILDGWFARRMRARRVARGLPTRNMGERGGRGAWLDPACDKAFVVSVIAAVWWAYGPPWWLLALVGAREIVLVPLLMVWRLLPHGPLDLRAGAAGKLATVTQFLALWTILAESNHQLGMALAAGVIGVLAVADYARRAVAMPPETSRAN